ncbi:MAG: hypothetical protein QW336_00980 [Candidatus Anstonellales archaeon]
MDSPELDLWIIFLLALIYSSISVFFIARQDFYKKYQEGNKRYWEEYVKFLKDGLKMTPEQIEERKNLLNSLLMEQFKNMLKISVVYLIMFLGAASIIQFLIVESPANHPYGSICIVDNKYIYENGVYKVPDLFHDQIVQDINPESYVCPRAILYLPFPILNLRYVVGEIKIFIFFVIIISIVLGILKKRIMKMGP